MGGQHKKNLRAEKAKVKFKSTKLPKGLNVTKTDFKVRKIELREQLRESSLQTVNGHRQLNLKEILSRLKHHNNKFRLDSLRNVRDAVKAGQAEHLIGHLNDLFQGIAAGALDIERDVRRDAFKTLDILLEALPSNAVVPFFNILAAYLRCAMTHVQPTIQEDSLLMLDVLLERVPAHLLAERSASTIISHFIDMISRSRNDTQRTNRVLTVRMGQGQGQQTTIKWRTKVLIRLQKILGTLLQHQIKSACSTRTQARVVHFDVNKPQYYNLLRPFVVDKRDLHTILNESHNRADNEQLRSYVEQLMPLLLDNWLEVRPQQQQQQQQLLNTDAADSLHVVLDIMKQLWELVLQYESTQQESKELSEWMRNTYSTNFVRAFLKDNSYPYQQSVTTDGPISKRAKKKLTASASGGQRCIAQNLSLVQLICHLWPQPDSDQADDYCILLQYINQCMRELNTLKPDEQLRLVTALRAVLLDNGVALLNVKAHQMGAVMSNCIDAYVRQQYTTREGVATRVLNFLCQIVQHSQLYEGYGGEQQFAPFLNYLPQLLLKPSVADGTLTAMSALCRQQNNVFLTVLAECATDVLNNIEQLQVTGDSTTDDENRFENQKRILNMFYYVRQKQDAVDLQTALEKLEKNASERVSNYFKCILSYE